MIVVIKFIINQMKRLCFIIFILLLSISNVHARWASYEDAAVEVDLYNVDLVVNKDGTYEYTFETKEKVLKENARNYAAMYRLNYNSNSSTLDIIEAKTIDKEGKEFKVTEDMIENKPLASIGYGFDDYNQILISYPNVEIGSSIYIKYKLKVNKVLLNQFFADCLSLMNVKYYKVAKATIKSELPLHLKANDPNNSLKITQTTDNGVDNIQITAIKPIYEEITDEPGNIVVNPKHLTWVSVSSLDKWEHFANRLSADYERVLGQPLPQLFDDIAKLAAKSSDDEQIINTVTSQLNDKIQYMGDWRSIEGKFVPRNLDKIASTQVGDCKDFTISAAAILKKLGFKVAPTLVSRGIYNWPAETLPGFAAFNHAMLKITATNGKVYWIDPTNIVSMASGIFPDIAGKKALVLNGPNSKCEVIPNIDFKHSTQTMTNHVKIKNDNTIYNSGKLILSGEIGSNISGLGLYYSNQQLEDMLYKMLTGTQLDHNQKKGVTLPNLKSRIVKDLTFSYEYEQSNRLHKTNLGSALTLTSDYVSAIVNTSSTQVGDLLIGPQFTLNKHTYIANAKVNEIERLNYEIKTPWVYVKRSCIYNKNNNTAEINETMSILKNFITKEDLSTVQYQDLKKSLEKNFIDAMIILQ